MRMITFVIGNSLLSTFKVCVTTNQKFVRPKNHKRKASVENSLHIFQSVFNNPGTEMSVFPLEAAREWQVAIGPSSNL